MRYNPKWKQELNKLRMKNLRAVHVVQVTVRNPGHKAHTYQLAVREDRPLARMMAGLHSYY